MFPVTTALLLAIAVASCAQDNADALSTSEPTTTERDDSDTTGTTEADDGDEDATGADTSIDWESCQGDLECAEFEVPVDYDEPDGETLTLSLLRSPASGDRIGALFVNPGGPGASATEFASAAAFALPVEITDRFDIVGIDVRGTGASAIDCGGDFEELYAVDYSIDSPEDEATLLEVSQEYVDGCASRVGPDILANLGTRDVARDMDAVRAAMGDDQLSYLGISYGTAIGQAYAELFPDRVRALVLDAVVDLGTTGVDGAEAQAVGFESALSAFVADCNADPGCPLAPDAMAQINQISQQVEQASIPGGQRDLGPGDLAIGLAYPLYAEELWPDLADAVDEALAGDGSLMIDLADSYLDIGSFDIYFSVFCLDFDWPATPAELLADGAAMQAQAPHFGASIVNDYVRCSMWPVEADPLPAVTAPGTPPILVISTTNDPATPYQAGVDTAARLESGVLLTNEGEGHGAVLGGIGCIDDAFVAYVVDLEPPPDGTTCG